MNIVKENTGLTSVLKIQLEKSDYQPQVDKSLKEYGKKVKLDGFRPGKVPFGIVKKMYGKYILVDEVNKLVSDSLSSYIEENKLSLLGNPLPSEDQKEIEWDNSEVLDFSFEIAEAPELDIKLNKKNKYTYYKIEVTDEMAQTQLDSLAARFGSQVNVDTTIGTEIVRGDLVQVDSDGNIVEEGHLKENASLLLTYVKNEKYAEQFKGKSVGDVFIFNPKAAFDSDVEVSSLLGIPKEDSEKMNADYQITIKELIRNQKAEMNQEFFDSAFGEGKVSSEQEALEYIKNDTSKRLEVNSDYKLFFDVKNKLVESLNVEFPEEFLKKWLLTINKEKGITAEQVDAEFHLFLEDLKWQLIKNNLLKANEIKVSNEDMIDAAKEFTKMQFAQFGMLNPSDEDLNKWGTELLKNKDEAQKIFDSELDKKLINLIKESVKLEDSIVSIEEFNKMLEN
jgi:trigger factor